MALGLLGLGFQGYRVLGFRVGVGVRAMVRVRVKVIIVEIVVACN